MELTTTTMKVRMSFKQIDRGVRRALVGGLVGAAFGIPVGALLGGVESALYMRQPMFGLAYGLWCGGVAGFPIGALVIVKGERKRLFWALVLGAVAGVAAGWLIGHALAQWDSSHMSFSGYLERVVPFIGFGVVAGLAGAWAVSSALGALRPRWRWMTRWDNWPNDGTEASALHEAR